ncbi:MAG: hypothetical protein ACLVJO_04455 [[Clostridium] scindens]
MNICPTVFRRIRRIMVLYELFYEGYGLSTTMDKVAGGSDIVKSLRKNGMIFL